MQRHPLSGLRGCGRTSCGGCWERCWNVHTASFRSSSACADSDQTNGPPDTAPYDTELWSNSFDLTGFDTVSLDFAGAFNDNETEDMFEVWVWDGGSWTMEAQWETGFNQIVSFVGIGA